MRIEVEDFSDERLAEWLRGADSSARVDAWARLVEALGRHEASRRWLLPSLRRMLPRRDPPCCSSQIHALSINDQHRSHWRALDRGLYQPRRFH
jgi:hypothetical protein